ncbi:MAG: streptomycin biosynthesis protein StrG [Gammaproteobacteria bacterium]
MSSRIEKLNYSKFGDGPSRLTALIKDLFDVQDLSLIHEQWEGAEKYDLLDDVETDQYTVYHKHFYNAFKGSEIEDVYKQTVGQFIEHLYDVPALYQAVPTFRVHQPSNLAVAAYHKDSEYAHSSHEVNIFMPFTRAFGNNTIWTESAEGLEDFAPMEAEIGECYVWNGANLLHGNKVNDTGVSRVSIDFRLLEKSKLVGGKVSTSNKTKMEIGGYWTEWQ